jgi:hypothetical protein
VTTRTRLALLGLLLIAPGHAMAQGQSQGNPRLDYMLQCQGCHSADGSGKPEAGIPAMLGLAGRFPNDSDARAYLVQVPGVSQAPLDDRAIADLLNWILKRFRVGPNEQTIPAFTEQEVSAYRAREPIDVVATRARLIARQRKPGTPLQ